MDDSDLNIVHSNCGLSFEKPGVKIVQFLWLEGTLEHPSF